MLLVLLAGCVRTRSGSTDLALLENTPLIHNSMSGNTAPVRDPSILSAGGRWYVFSTDAVGHDPAQFLSIRCSYDRTSWTACGQVFTSLPRWVQRELPGVHDLWAPDISYFNGEYHLYYVASRLHTQESVIGLATNRTLNPNDPAYEWVDRGEVLRSRAGDDFNALDPNIFLDTDGRIWMSYGSYWSGIKQREIDPATGFFSSVNTTRYDLAARPSVPDHAVEGASLVQHGAFYYLFLSVDHCCESSLDEDDYKEVVGRSASVNGPFYDSHGRLLLDGGGSVLLEGNNRWRAPGGATAYVDPASGDNVLVFHALDMSANGTAALWSKTLHWQNDWPVLD